MANNCNKTFRDLIESGQAQILGIVSEVPMGDWNATTTYQKLNYVRYNGATYKAKTSNTNVEPGISSGWEDVWMLCTYDGGGIAPDGTYPNMTVGNATNAMNADTADSANTAQDAAKLGGVAAENYAKTDNLFIDLGAQTFDVSFSVDSSLITFLRNNKNVSVLISTTSGNFVFSNFMNISLNGTQGLYSPVTVINPDNTSEIQTILLSIFPSTLTAVLQGIGFSGQPSGNYALQNGTYPNMIVGKATNADSAATAQNSQQLGGKAADQYALKSDITTGGIVAVDVLPTATQIEYDKHLLYLQGEDLNYLVRTPMDEPTVSDTSSLPSAMYDVDAAAVGTDCYIFRRNGSSGNVEIVKFDTISQTATLLSVSLSTTVSNLHSAVAVGANCYYFYGRRIIKFDTITQTITQLSEQLPIIADAAAVVGTDCYIFYSNEIAKFDTVSQTATELSAEFQWERTYKSAAAVGTDCYLFGGSFFNNGTRFYPYINKFDTVSQTATLLSVELPSERAYTSAAAIGTDCYIFGGSEGAASSTYLTDIVKFDTISQTVTTLSAKLPSKRRETGAAVVGTDCYIFGGRGSSGSLAEIVKVAFGYVYSYRKIIKQGDITYETV